MESIKNKVKESGLIQLDMADFRPKMPIEGIDISNQLWQGLVLKEKDFRLWIKEHDWSQYKEKAIFIFCSTDAIIPTWAFMLIGSELSSFAIYYEVGSAAELEKSLIKQNIEALALAPFTDQRIIVKGCAEISCPEFTSSLLVKHLRPVVKAIMFGEPCSTVPIYKKR